MSLMFNLLLKSLNVDLTDVRYLRHKDNRSEKGHTIYELWRDDPHLFNQYQKLQNFNNQAKLDAKYWAAFIGTPADETMFVGLYQVKNRTILDHDMPKPHMDGIDTAGSCDEYELVLMDELSDMTGRLFIDWGPGDRAWIQRADNQDKPIFELRTAFIEPNFPGYLHFIEPLSKMSALPRTWITALESIRGIYLLTCPKTKEQYVGSATGESGFWGRWQNYISNGHGGDIALKSRELSDYQVSILEVAGSINTVEEIIAMETRWKIKLQSREMGLNRN